MKIIMKFSLYLPDTKFNLSKVYDILPIDILIFQRAKQANACHDGVCVLIKILAV